MDVLWVKGLRWRSVLEPAYPFAERDELVQYPDFPNDAVAPFYGKRHDITHYTNLNTRGLAIRYA